MLSLLAYSSLSNRKYQLIKRLASELGYIHTGMIRTKQCCYTLV